MKNYRDERPALLCFTLNEEGLALKRQRVRWSYFYFVMLIFIIGCSGERAKEIAKLEQAISKDPVTITATNDGGTKISDSFVELISEQLHKKYPNITFDYFEPGQGQDVVCGYLDRAANVPFPCRWE